MKYSLGMPVLLVAIVVFTGEVLLEQAINSQVLHSVRPIRNIYCVRKKDNADFARYIMNLSTPAR